MSELIIAKRPNLGFIPEVVGYLASIKEPDYIYTDYKVRHPRAVFNYSKYYVVMDFIDLLKELEENQNNFNKENQLDRKFRNLISDFFKFYDSCYEVMLGCCKQHTPPSENLFIWRWLEDKKEEYHKGQKYRVGKEFDKKTRKEINYFRMINNKLKHTSNTIWPVYFHDPSRTIMGFYVEAVIGVRTVGPDESIHPKYDGNTQSANSYNFKLRELYYLFYMVSETLKETIINHYKEIYNLDLEFDERYNEDHKITDKYEKDLFKRINSLPHEYFPNEFGNKIFEVREEIDKLIFAEKTAESIILNGAFSFIRRGDESSTYGVPYLSEKTFIK